MLAFHMELMTPEVAIELLVERVGFERVASEAEVRRSFTGESPPRDLEARWRFHPQIP